MDDRPSSDEFFKVQHGNHVRFFKVFKEANRIEFCRDSFDNIIGLRVVPYFGCINSLRKDDDDHSSDHV